MPGGRPTKLTAMLEIKYVSPQNLIPYENNAKLHDGNNVDNIAASINEFGFNNPVLLDGDNGIVAGHGRVLAAIKLGLESVPTVDLTHLDSVQKRAYILADNKLAEDSVWNFDIVSDELKALLDDDFDISLTGFDFDNIEEEPVKVLTDEDEVPDPPEEPVTRRGDIWQLGDHRLMCGDSTSVDDVELLMNGEYPAMIHTDPPYGMSAVSKSGVLSKNYKIDIIGDDNQDVAKNAFKLIHSLYPDAKQIWWGANYYCSVLPDSECWLVWDKNNGGSDQTDCELAWANFRSVVRQFTMASEKTNRVHPTQKPVELMGWIIKRFKFDGGSIADFFGGSGSTLIAAEKAGKKSFLMEFDVAFCDVIIKRWENYTGRKAERAN